jgi:hypothetical protein
MPKMVTPEEVFLGPYLSKARQRRPLKGTWNWVADRLGRPAPETREEWQSWGVPDWMVAWMVRDKELEAQIESAQGRAVVVSDGDVVEELKAEVARRMDDLLDAYEAPTPNDRDMLRSYVTLMVQVHHMEDMLLGASEIDDKLVTQIRDLQREARQIEKQLGIDRLERDKRRADPGADLLTEICRETKRYLEDEIVQITHCDVLLGWVWDGFPSRPILLRTQCPKCGAVVSYGQEGGAMEAPILREEYPEVMTLEELERVG